MARLKPSRTLTRIFGLMIAVFSLFGTAQPRVAAQGSSMPNTGRDFLFAFSELALRDISGQTWDEQQVYLLISADAPASGLVDFTTPYLLDMPFSTSIGDQVTVELPKADGAAHPAAALAGISDYSVRVTSDVDITLQAIVFSPGKMTDALLIPPTSAGGTEFVVPSYASPAEYAADDTNHAGFLVVAHENNTTVNYLTRSELPPAGDNTQTEEIWFSGTPDYTAIETISLDAGEVFVYQLRDRDPSGSIVESDKPVTVYGYSACANVPIGSGTCDLLFESVPPVAAWGTEYLIPPAAFRTYQDTYRAYAWQDDTLITADGSSEFANLQAGEYVEYRMQANIPVSLQSTKPFMLVRYFNSTEWDSLQGDASMVVMVPTDAWLTAASVTFPSISGVYYLQGTAVIAPRNAVVTNNTSSSTVSGWTQIAGTDYDYAVVPGSVGTYRFSSSEPFIAYVWATRMNESYAYPAGYDLAPSWEPQSLLAPHMQGGVCELIPDMAISPERIVFDAAGRAELTVTMRNRCNDLPFNGSDLLVSLSDGLTVIDGSAGLVNLGQRAAWQNLSLTPAETRSWTLTVQAPAMLPTAPLHVAELYHLGRVASRIDGIFLGAAAAAADAAPTAAPAKAAAPAASAPLPAVLPNTVGEREAPPTVLLPIALLTAAMLLFSIVLRRLPHR